MLARPSSQASVTMHDLLAAPPPADLASLLASLRQVEALLDAMPGVVFFVKDERARYVLVNRTLARRCGVKDKAELLGRSADEVFPSSLGPLYAEQDRRVLRGGAALENQLELHLYPGRQPGWCLTHKQALRDADGAIIGMAGISHDLPAAQSAHPAYGRLAAVDAYIREHYDQPLSRPHR
ncbi:AraC family transcriptional regulator, partial [Pseudomonas aeruginosa]